VQRDPGTGDVIGHFACPQPGYAEEAVADDHPDLVQRVAWVKARIAAKVQELKAARG
jgi:hypothetical protein